MRDAARRPGHVLDFCCVEVAIGDTDTLRIRVCALLRAYGDAMRFIFSGDGGIKCQLDDLRTFERIEFKVWFWEGPDAESHWVEIQRRAGAAEAFFPVIFRPLSLALQTGGELRVPPNPHPFPFVASDALERWMAQSVGADGDVLVVCDALRTMAIYCRDTGRPIPASLDDLEALCTLPDRTVRWLANHLRRLHRA